MHLVLYLLLLLLLLLSWWHLVFNVVVQLLVGAPLEMKHGPIRIATIYMSGVLAGTTLNFLLNTCPVKTFQTMAWLLIIP